MIRLNEVAEQKLVKLRETVLAFRPMMIEAVRSGQWTDTDGTFRATDWLRDTFHDQFEWIGVLVFGAVELAAALDGHMINPVPIKENNDEQTER